ncbi:hypothetical protein MRX96_029616 [Rhipicephalus microplus]
MARGHSYFYAGLGEKIAFAVLFLEGLAAFLLGPATTDERVLHLMTSVREFRDSPVAIIAAGSLSSNVLRNLNISSTLWSCEGINSRCYRSLLRYITPTTPFPRHSFVFAPWRRGLPKGILEEVKRLDVSHPYIYWVFTVREHSDVDAVLMSNSCQVVTVAEKDIRIAADGYKNCSKRASHSGLEWQALLGTAESEAYYPRDQRFDYAFSYEKLHRKCTDKGPVAYLDIALTMLKIRNPEGVALLEAYSAINSTLYLQCSDVISGETLLHEKRVDFLLHGWFEKESTSVLLDVLFVVFCLLAPSVLRNHFPDSHSENHPSK